MSIQSSKITKLATASLACGLIELAWALLYISAMVINELLHIKGNYALGFFTLLTLVIIPLLSITSIILGVIALIKIRRNPNLKGKRRAKIGVKLGILIPILALISLLMFGTYMT